MKILMIAPTPFFSDRGCHVRIYEEIKALQKLGHEIVLCTYGLGKDVDGVNIVRTISLPWYKKISAGPSYTKILLLPFLTLTSLKQIHKFKPDIVHAHLHEGALIARLCKIFYRKPKYVFDMQGSLAGETLQHGFIKKDGFRYRFFVWLEKIIDSWFFIMPSTKSMSVELENLGIGKERYTSINDGVDVSVFSPRSPNYSLAEKCGIDLNSPKVVFLGHMDTYQGVDVLIEAFAKIVDKREKAQLILLGYPNVEKYKKMCEDFQISNNVFVLGKVNYLQAPEYLSLADVAVAPKISLTESDGKIYNYMAMALPVVAFERDISREILAETGIFAKFNDANDMALKLLWAIDNKQEAFKLGLAARDRVVREFSWDAIAKKIQSVYEML